MAKVAKRVAIATQNSGKSSGKHQWQKVRTYLSTYLAFGLWLAFKESGETSKQSSPKLRVGGGTVAC